MARVVKKEGSRMTRAELISSGPWVKSLGKPNLPLKKTNIVVLFALFAL
jgi:hypothetical protein